MDWQRFTSLFRQLLKGCMAYKYCHPLLVLTVTMSFGRKGGNISQLKRFN